MRILDKYILRELIIPFMFSLYILMFLFVMADMFDHLSEIINNKPPLKQLLAYYLNLLPFSLVQTVSWALFFGVLYLFTSMTRHSELIAMKACGLKITSIAMPVLFFGFAVGVVTFVINDRLVPHTFERAQMIGKQYIEIASSTPQPKEFALSNTTMLSRNRQYFIKSYEPATHTMHDIRIHFLTPNNTVKQKINAQKAVWENDHWVFSGVSIYNLDENGHIIGEPEVKSEHVFPDVTERPQEFIDASSDIALMGSKELKKHIERLTKNGLNAHTEYAALHEKQAFPWQGLVIMFATIPLLARTGNIRGNFAKHILLAILLVFGYHVATAIALSLGKSGVLFSSASAWLANILFTTGGLIYFDKANY